MGVKIAMTRCQAFSQRYVSLIMVPDTTYIGQASRLFLSHPEAVSYMAVLIIALSHDD